MLLKFTDGLKGWYGKRHLCGVLALGHKMQSNGKIDSMQAFNTNKCKLQTKAMTISGNPKAQCQLWMVDAMHDEALRADVHVKAFYADMKACTQAHFFHHMKLPKSRQQKKFTLPNKGSRSLEFCCLAEISQGLVWNNGILHILEGNDMALLVIFGFNQGASGPQHQFTSTKALFASHSKEKRLEADKWALGNKTQMHRHKISWLLMPQPRNNKALQDAAQK